MLIVSILLLTLLAACGGEGVDKGNGGELVDKVEPKPEVPLKKMRKR